MRREAQLAASSAVLLAVAMAAVAGWTFSFSSPVAPPEPHVVHIPSSGRAFIVGADGRALLLRGVAVTGLVDYATDYRENPPLTPSDFDEIAALGLDYVRLPVSWSRIEPSPGRFDTSYLRQVAAVVSWAWARGIGAVVDLHNDRYARSLAPGDEADGAPDWATLPAAGDCLRSSASAVCQRAAWQSFWQDVRVGGLGLQRHYIAALIALSRALRSSPGVLGLELINNPSPGDTASPAFERAQLWPFCRRAIAALRAAGERRPLWIDRSAGGEETDASTAPVQRFSADRDLVYAPHDYTGVFSSPAWPTGGVDRLRAWYSTATSEASALGMPLIVGEWGNGDESGAEDWIDDQVGLQNSYALGSAYWMWKQRPGFYNWELVGVDGSLRAGSLRAQAVSQPHPDAVPGMPLGFSFASGRLSVRIRGDGGVASLWSGTRVVTGGPSLLPAPLLSAYVDGRRVHGRLTWRRFSGPSVRLAGAVVQVPVPRGTHTITLSSAQSGG